MATKQNFRRCAAAAANAVTLIMMGYVKGLQAEDCLVTRFGALCDSVTDDTIAVQTALDACGNHKGEVRLPPGKTCLSFPLSFSNGTSLHLPPGSTLKAFPSVSHWPNNTMYNFVELKRKRDIAVYGSGTIDGTGSQWWVLPGFANFPRMFHMEMISNVSFVGVTLLNSPAMTLAFGSPCTNIMVDGVTIHNYAVGQTDGIDVGCDGALIQNTRVINGDDSICMKSEAKNVLVRNCTIDNGIPFPGSLYHGLAGGLVLGTSDNDSMENVTYTNCTITGALAGIRLKFRPTQHGYIQGILFEHIRIHRPVTYVVDLLLNSNHLAERAGGETVRLGNVTMRDIHGELEPVPESVCGKGKSCPRAVGRFLCTGDSPCDGIVLRDFRVTGFNSTKAYPIACDFQHITGLGSDVSPKQCMPPALAVVV